MLPVRSSRLTDEEGFLSEESVAALRRIDRDLRNRNEDLAEMSGVSRETWNNWFYRRRKPAHGAVAFLGLLIMEPMTVIDLLTTRMRDAVELNG